MRTACGGIISSVFFFISTSGLLTSRITADDAREDLLLIGAEMCCDISATSFSVSELVTPGVIAGKTDGGDGPRGGGGGVWLMSLTILRLMVIVSLFFDEEISQKRYEGLRKSFEIVPACGL